MGLNFADFTHGKENVVGGHIHYRLAGNGEIVVLLHGWPQHSLQWHSVAPRLAERYRVLVPDLPGCGDSSIPRTGYDKKTIAASHVATRVIEGAVHWISDENLEALAESLLEFFG